MGEGVYREWGGKVLVGGNEFCLVVFELVGGVWVVVLGEGDRVGMYVEEVWEGMDEGGWD